MVSDRQSRDPSEKTEDGLVPEVVVTWGSHLRTVIDQNEGGEQMCESHIEML